MAPIIITISTWRRTTIIRPRRGRPGPPPPPDRARYCSSSPWRGPAPPCHPPATASTPWNTPIGRTPLMRRTIRLIAWNKTTTGCYRMVSPAHWPTTFRGSGPTAASRVWIRVRRTKVSAKRPYQMVSRLCTWRGVLLICRILGRTNSVQGELHAFHVESRLYFSLSLSFALSTEQKNLIWKKICIWILGNILRFTLIKNYS